MAIEYNPPLEFIYRFVFFYTSSHYYALNYIIFHSKIKNKFVIALKFILGGYNNGKTN